MRYLSEASVILAYTDADGWSPGIGDPTVMGWVTVVAYFSAAIFCGLASFRSRSSMDLRSAEARFWGLLCLALVFLGVNKQLDLQTWLTLTGKRLAQAQGWYEQRRVVQVLFLCMILVAGLWMLNWIWKNLRQAPLANWVAVAGFIFLGCFIMIRAASFHHVDAFLKWGPGNLRMNWILELGGLALITWGALKRSRSGPAVTNRAAAPGVETGKLRGSEI